jgi:hypothetical protein
MMIFNRCWNLRATVANIEGKGVSKLACDGGYAGLAGGGGMTRPVAPIVFFIFRFFLFMRGRLRRLCRWRGRREPLVNRRAMNNDKVKEIEEKITDLKGRWPAHSVPPSLWQELEELEEALKDAKESDDN